jgi:hypothetical protein
LVDRLTLAFRSIETKIIRITSHIGKDGILRLEVPVSVRDQDLDVLLVVNPVSGKAPGASDEDLWPPGFFESTAGAFRDEPLGRGGE